MQLLLGRSRPWIGAVSALVLAGCSSSPPTGGAGGPGGAGGSTSNATGGDRGGGTGAAGAGGDSGGAGTSDAGAPQTAVPAGDWTGTWSNDGAFGLSFTVTDAGQVRGFTVTDSATACGATGDVEAGMTGPVAIAADGSFGITVTGCGPNVRCYTDRIQGKLSNDGTATGTIRRYGACNLTCTSVSTGGDRTWTAALGCSLRPQSGWSATRFCDAAGASHAETPAPGSTSSGSLSCSVAPPPSNGAGGGAGASGGSGGGAAGGAGGSAGGPVTDLGEPCTSSYCSSTSSWCYDSAVASCDGQWCVGSGSGMYCSKPCTSDLDCAGGAVSMKCLVQCNLPGPAIANHCWDVNSYAVVAAACGG